MKKAGWSQAETSRRLELTTGAVSQMVNRQTKPSQQTLKLFRLILETEGIATEKGESVSEQSTVSLGDNKKSVTSVEPRGAAGVQRERIPPEREGGRVKHPSYEDAGGVTLVGNLAEKLKADIEHLAQNDPAKLRELEPIITTYRQSSRKKKKAKHA